MLTFYRRGLECKLGRKNYDDLYLNHINLVRYTDIYLYLYNYIYSYIYTHTSINIIHADSCLPDDQGKGGEIMIGHRSQVRLISEPHFYTNKKALFYSKHFFLSF